MNIKQWLNDDELYKWIVKIRNSVKSKEIRFIENGKVVATWTS